MSDDFEQYAVYWVPKRPDSLARFGASWTGWCADLGEYRTRGAFDGLSFDTAAITRQTRRHGFHAVVLESFHLGSERSFFALEHVLGRLVEECVSFQLPRFRLAVVDGRVSLVPSQSSPALVEMIDRIGNALGSLGIPSTGFAEASATALAPRCDRARTADPVINFPPAAAHRFHMPLTDRIDSALAVKVMEQLQPVLASILREPRQLIDLALMGDPGEGRPLRVLQRYELRDWPLRKTSSAMPCHGPHVLLGSFNDPLAKSEIAI